MQRWVFLLSLIFTLCGDLNAQNFPDFTAADKFAKDPGFPVKDKQGLDSLVRLVDEKFSTEEEKIRALFTWVATHLEYDCGNDTASPLRSVSVDQVLKSGKSQCAG